VAYSFGITLLLFSPVLDVLYLSRLCPFQNLSSGLIKMQR